MNRLKAYVRDLAAKAVDRVLMATPQLQKLQSEVQNLQAAYGQLRDVVMEAGGLLPPPRNLQVRVVGVYASDFIESGHLIVNDINNVLANVNETLESRRMILDFGCGCARVLRALHSHVPSGLLCGTDIDAEAIEWCKANYSDVAEFSTNPTMPPTRYPESTFDLIYSISVFTHLPEDMQFAWLQELYRIAKPGAYLLLSVHGENHYHKVPAESRRTIRDKGFYYLDVGVTEGLPSFYQASFHSHEYIRSRWSEYFDIVCITKRAISDSQDAVLCHKR